MGDAAPLRQTTGAPAPVGNVDLMTQGGDSRPALADGTQVWYTPGHACDPPKPGCGPAQSGAVTAIPGVVFSGSLDGHVRGYSAEDGQVLWDFDTAKDYTTVNGVPGRGGSMDGAGPVIVGGMIYVNSGYPRNGGMPGNVLLAFGPEN